VVCRERLPAPHRLHPLRAAVDARCAAPVPVLDTFDDA
jgi:hypothetical protein